MKITMTQPENYPLVNDPNCNGFVNHLTIFDDGDVRIEELPRHEASSISSYEHEGRAVSCHLPGVVFDTDVEKIQDWLESLNFEQVKDQIISDGIPETIEFYDDYAHGWYEDIINDDEMQQIADKCNRNVDSIADAIRADGETYVALEDWIENWLDNNPADTPHYDTIQDAHTALLNGGVLDFFPEDFDTSRDSDIVEWMYRNDKTPVEAAQHFGFAD